MCTDEDEELRDNAGHKAGTELTLTRECFRSRCGSRSSKRSTARLSPPVRAVTFARSLGDECQTSQLDCTLGPNMDTRATSIHNDVKLCCTWDHYLVYAVVQEDDGQGYFAQSQKKNKAGQDGDRPPRTGKIAFEKVAGADAAEKTTPEDVSGPVERQILRKQARKAG